MPADDLGAFYDPHVYTYEAMALEFPQIDGFTVEVEGNHIILAGYTLLMTVNNTDPGEFLEGVRIRVYDINGELLKEDFSGQDGSFIFALPVPQSGVDGYFEIFKDGYPLIRQFDRRLDENWTNIRLRLFDQPLYDIPRTLLNQQDDMGYIQGSIYDKETEIPLSGVVIEASSGEVVYLSDALLAPVAGLKATQSKGVFFVANSNPGIVTVKAKKDGVTLAEKSVITWKNGILTQLGLPVNNL